MLSSTGPLKAAVIDKANMVGYFATYTAPSIIVKVSLGAGNTLPTRISALTLNAGEDYISAGKSRSNREEACLSYTYLPISILR